MRLTLILVDTKSSFIPTKQPYQEFISMQILDEFPNKFSNFVGRTSLPSEGWNIGVWLDDQRTYIILMLLLCGSILIAAAKIIKKLRKSAGSKSSKSSHQIHEMSTIEIDTGRPESNETAVIVEEDSNLKEDSPSPSPPRSGSKTKYKGETTESKKKGKKTTRPKKE